MKPLRRLLLCGLSIHLAIAAGTLRAQPATLPPAVVGDWSYYNNMGWKAFNRGDYDIAENRFEKAIEQVKPYRAISQRLLVRSYYDLSRVLYMEKRYADAEPLLKWVVDVRKPDPDVKADVLFDSLYLLALIHREQHHDAQAEQLFHEALRIEEKAVGLNDPSLTATLCDLASVEFRLEKYDRAEPHLRRALTILKRSGSILNPTYADTLERYAKVLDQLDRGDEAQAAEAEVERLRHDFQGAVEKAQRAGFRPTIGRRAADFKPATP
ncbi:MAG: tetratricopeptide repeat protein [Paludisphaera borealis]|uniref:tetratricopeptide repeat protein n=1 Tax=Paludisphaera borealis TaxID=1387353 RepID=UPI002850E9C8|nr:tetratricopeptide repeat protein [Paludisphaera borealis]MDR3622422.1 tetratricopeptide repeat protein [Paludisphaera borealis]